MSKTVVPATGDPVDSDDTDTGFEGSGCPTYSGVLSVEDQPRWDFHAEDYMLGTHYLSRFVQSVDGSTGTGIIHEYQFVGSDCCTWSVDTYVTFLCDATGFSMVSYTFETTAQAPGIDARIEGPAGTVVFDTPVLLVPAEFTVGDTWSTSRSGVVTHTTGETWVTTDSSVAEVIGEEDVEFFLEDVPAFRVDETTSYGTLSYWYNRQYGLIKVGNFVINTYEDGFPEPD